MKKTKSKKLGSQESQSMSLLMGSIVVVSKVFERKERAEKSKLGRNTLIREWVEKEIEPRPGWIVGFRWIQWGEVPEYYGYDEQRYLSCKGVIQCYLVCFWPTQSFVRVPLDGITFQAGARPFRKFYKWSDRDREQLRTEMSRVKRDARGRWTGNLSFPMKSEENHG